MSWLVKIDNGNFEVWSDAEYSMKKQKCEYYGSKPAWEEVRQLESTVTTSELKWESATNWEKKKKFAIQ